MGITFGTIVETDFDDAAVNNDGGELPLSLTAGDLVYLHILLRNQLAVTFSTPPAWNGQNFTLISQELDYATDGINYVYRLVASSTAVAQLVTFEITAYEPMAVALFPVFGADTTLLERSIHHAEVPEGPGSYTLPSLTVTDAEIGDAIIAFLGSIGWDEGYGDMSAAVWEEGDDQTALYDVSSITPFNGAPRVLGSYKTVTDADLGVNYTTTPLHPKWQFVAFALAPYLGASITSAPTPIRRDSSNAVVTNNLGTRESATFGSIVCGISSGQVIVPPWSHGIEDDMDIGTYYDLTLTDTDDVEATTSRPYGLPTGYTHNIIGDGIAVDTGPDSICSDPAIVADCDIYAPPLGGGTLTNDGNFHNVPFGVYPGFWLRDLDNIMWTFTVTLIATAIPDKYIIQVGGKLREQAALTESSGEEDSGRIIALRGNGTLDPGFLPVVTGVTDGDPAETGMVGELLTASVAAVDAVSLTSTTAANIITLNLTAGEWDINGVIAFDADPTTTTAYSKSSISSVSVTHGVVGTYCTQIAVPVSIIDRTEVLPTVRVRFASATTIYLVCQADFSVSTLAAYGTIRATRVR